MIHTDTACGCRANRCCGGYHEIRVDGLLHPELKALVGARLGVAMRAFRRYTTDGTPVAERVTTDDVATDRDLDTDTKASTVA